MTTVTAVQGGHVESIDDSNKIIREIVEARNAVRSVPSEPPSRPSLHPTSQAFFDLCDQLKQMHRQKSSDYGSPCDPLANIRNGAEFVGIEPWRAAMVRLSDKVTRLATYCRTGSLTYESFEDTCFDLASYALLTLLTHREAAGEGRKGC